MKTKEHLDLDLSFLDKREEDFESIENYYSKESDSSTSGKNKLRWKPILIITGIIIFIWIASSNNNSSGTSTDTNNSSIKTFEDGQYSCSATNHEKAINLKPDPAEKSALDSFVDEINNLNDEIESKRSVLNNYSQYEVDQFNELVDEYNQKRDQYKSRKDVFNASVDEYNAFLEENCTKR